MRFCPLFSGSSGNSIYVGSDNTHLLIDVGVPKKYMDEALNCIGLTGNDVSGILITHEHSDHIGGLGVFLRKHPVPVYATAKTIDKIFLNPKSLGCVDDSLFHVVDPDTGFLVGDIEAVPFRVSHDAADPVAYRFKSGEKKLAVCTDLGCYDDYTVSNLKGLDTLLIEANHDIPRLQTNPKYPYYLKRRILSDKGHLCNEASGRLLSSVLHDDLKKIYLGHLSKDNNYPDLAFEAVRCEINMDSSSYKANDFDIAIAKRDTVSECFEF